jgi:uncharacterized coiled-coil protein SlyX
MGKLADEIATQSALVDEKLNRADLSLQQARIVAELAHVAAVQCLALDLLVARLEGLEKKVKKLQKAGQSRK